MHSPFLHLTIDRRASVWNPYLTGLRPSPPAPCSLKPAKAGLSLAGGIPQTRSSSAAVDRGAILKSVLFLLSTLHECGQSKTERACRGMSLPRILPDTVDDLL